MTAYQEKLSKFLRELSETKTKNDKVTFPKQAEEMNVPLGSLKNYLYGRGADSSFATLCQIADYYQVSTDYLLGRTDAKSPETDVRAVCEYTGLSDSAVNALHNHAKMGSCVPKSMPDTPEEALKQANAGKAWLVNMTKEDDTIGDDIEIEFDTTTLSENFAIPPFTVSADVSQYDLMSIASRMLELDALYMSLLAIVCDFKNFRSPSITSFSRTIYSKTVTPVQYREYLKNLCANAFSILLEEMYPYLPQDSDSKHQPTLAELIEFAPLFETVDFNEGGSDG